MAKKTKKKSSGKKPTKKKATKKVKPEKAKPRQSKVVAAPPPEKESKAVVGELEDGTHDLNGDVEAVEDDFPDDMLSEADYFDDQTF